ncbi:MAG: 3-phosphoshikimate 1-carboxyvinyltransferase [Bacteroidota bacterium]
MIEIRRNKEHIKCQIKISGSKSLNNRLLMLKKVLQIKTELINESESDDTLNLKEALNQIETHGSATLNAQHAGTNMRFLTAYLAAFPGNWIITGSDRMLERPIGELVNALRQLGADISYLNKEGFPPLKIKGQLLSKSKCTINSSISSQYISALLLMSPLLQHGLELELTGEQVSKPYIQMTLALLRDFGQNFEIENNKICIQASKTPNNMPSQYFVESDWSSASYWYSLCAISNNAEIGIEQLFQNSLQADSVIKDILQEFGIQTTAYQNKIILKSGSTHINKFDYNFMVCPDIAQTLAVVCLAKGVEGHLRGLSTLKIKETNRLLAMKTELEKFGAQVEIDENSMHIYPKDPSTLAQQSFSINTYNDHRMALSFAPLAFICEAIYINHPEVVNKSYARYWEDLKSAGFSVNLTP